MPDLPETRQSLLVRLNEVDHETAWQTFIDIYEPAIFAFARSRGLQVEDARDVTQQVLVAVHQRVGDWDFDKAKGSFRGWLFRVTRNLAAKQIRQSGRQIYGDVAGQNFDDLPAPSEEDKTIFTIEFRRQVFRWAAESIRDQFTSKSWQAFWRTSIDGDSAAVVAEESQMSIGAVYAAKCRIMTKMRELIQQLSDSDLPHETDHGKSQ